MLQSSPAPRVRRVRALGLMGKVGQARLSLPRPRLGRDSWSGRRAAVRWVAFLPHPALSRNRLLQRNSSLHHPIDLQQWLKNDLRPHHHLLPPPLAGANTRSASPLCSSYPSSTLPALPHSTSRGSTASQLPSRARRTQLCSSCPSRSLPAPCKWSRGISGWIGDRRRMSSM